jgi:hypothetical protein
MRLHRLLPALVAAFMVLSLAPLSAAQPPGVPPDLDVPPGALARGAGTVGGRTGTATRGAGSGTWAPRPAAQRRDTRATPRSPSG